MELPSPVLTPEDQAQASENAGEAELQSAAANDAAEDQAAEQQEQLDPTHVDEKILTLPEPEAPVFHPDKPDYNKLAKDLFSPKTDLKAVHEQVQDASPDQAAKLIDLSKRSGANPEEIHGNEDVYERALSAPAPHEWAMIESDHPKVAEFLKNPINMAVAYDDTKNLSSQSSIVKHFKNAIGYIVGNFALGGLQEQQAFIQASKIPGNVFGHDPISSVFRTGPWSAALQGIDGKDPEQYLAHLNERIEVVQKGMPADVGTTAKALGGLAHLASFLSGNAGYAVLYGGAGALAGPGTAAIGAGVGATLYNFNYGVGAFRQAMVELSDKSGKPLDETTINVSAVLGGFLATGVASKAGAGGLKLVHGSAMRLLPEPILEKFVTSYGKKVLTDPMTFQKAAQAYVANALKNAGRGALGMTEFKIIEELTIGGAKKASGQPFDYDPRESLSGVAQTAVDSAFMFGAGAVISAGAQYGMNKYQGKAFSRDFAMAERVRQEQQFYKAMGDTAEASKLRERMPDAHKDFLRELIGDTPVKTVYIPREAFTKYFQKSNVEGVPGAVAEALGVRDQLAAPVGDIAIPLDVYVNKFVGTPHYQSLSGDVKFDREGHTVNEMKELKAAQEIQMQAAQQAAVAEDKAAKPDTSGVHAEIKMDVLRQLNESGYLKTHKYRNEILDAESETAAHHYVTEAERRKVDPADLYRVEGPKITGPEGEVRTFYPMLMQQAGLMERKPILVTGEAIPSKSLGTALPDARMEAKEQITAKAVRNLAGLGKLIGAEVSVRQSRGSWKGDINPNIVFEITPSGDPSKDAATAEKVARLVQFAHRQDAVPWFQLTASPKGEKDNAVLIKFKSLDEAGEAEFVKALGGVLTSGAGSTTLPEGVLVFKPEGMSSEAFHNAILGLDAAHGERLGISALEAHHADVNWGPSHDWRSDPQGRALVDNPSFSGQPALQEGAARLARRYDEEIAGSRYPVLDPGGAGDRAGAGRSSLFPQPQERHARPLDGLPAGSSGPTPEIKLATEIYAASRGLPEGQPTEYVKSDPARGVRIADEFEAAKHDPEAPAVKAAYSDLIRETVAQFQAIKAMGIAVEAQKPGAQPYKNSAEMIADVRSGHLWFLPTGKEMRADHPLSAMTQESLADGTPLMANDVFRIVHDVFGHAKEGTTFGAHGEENAWQSHVRMYSPLAAMAMTTETRGQNSWVNFHPKSEANRTKPGSVYAEQKAALLPRWVMTEGLAKSGSAPLRQGGLDPTRKVAEPFYHKLQKDIETKIQGSSATVEQLRAILRDSKADEVKWSGIDEFLKGKEKIDKAELLEFLKNNQIEISDRTHGGEKYEAAVEEKMQEVMDEAFFDSYEDPYYVTSEKDADGKTFHLVANSYDRSVRDESKLYRSESDAEDQASKLNDDLRDYQYEDWKRGMNSRDLETFRRKAIDKLDPSIEGEGPTKYEEYTLPGGDNYRELLFVIADKARQRANKIWQERRDAEAEMEKVSAKKRKTKKDRERVEALKAQVVKLRGDSEATGNEEQFGFNSSHFDTENVLAHTRLKDRRDSRGNRVLFIEEIQSDWHQKGREEGYAGGYENVKAEDFQMVEVPDGGGRFHIAVELNGKHIASFASKPQAEANIPLILKDMKAGKIVSGKVPDAPLKKTWHEFVMKRLLRYAAENGYDKIGWTTGEQQAERYSLDKQVDSLVYDPATKNLIAYQGGRERVNTTATPEGLPDIIGREAAEKLLATTPAKGTASIEDFAVVESEHLYHIQKKDEDWGMELGRTAFSSAQKAREYALRMFMSDRQQKEIAGKHVLSGLDLKMGGEGMKGFYDKMLVSFANKFGKKWGAQVGQESVKLDDGRGRLALVHTMPLTRELIGAAIHEGFPLFQKTFGEYYPDQNVIRLLHEANASTFLHESAHGWLKGSFDFVRSGQADQAYMEHWQAAKDWLKIEDGQKELTEAQQEKFANGFETYMSEGKAPSPELSGLFYRFSRWLRDVFKRVRRPDVEMSPGIRSFMDRMLATDSEIERAASEAGYQVGQIENLPGVDPQVQQRARTLQERARQQAEEVLIKEQMAEFSQENKDALGRERERLSGPAEAAVAEQPLYRAMEDVEANRPGPRRGAFSLAQDFLADKLPRQEAGAFEAAAEVHGFADGRDLAESIIADQEHGGRQSSVKRRVDEGMNRFAEMRNTDALRERAREVIHSEKATELLALEQQILTDLVHQKDVAGEVSRRRRMNAGVQARFARDHAKAVLADKPAGEAGNFRAYITAERNAAVKVAKSIAAGDLEAASAYKAEQMLNHALASESLKIKAEIGRIKRFMDKYAKRGPDMLNMPFGFVRQIDGLLASSGLANPRPEDQSLMMTAQKMVAEKREPGEIANATGYVQDATGQLHQESLPEFVARVNDSYFGLELPPTLTGQRPLRQAMTDMTMAELRDLRAGINEIATVGRMFERFLSDFIKGDLKTNAAALRKHVEEKVGKPHGNVPALGEIEMGRARAAVESVLSLPDGMIVDKVNLLTLSEYLDRLDPDGPAKNNIYRPLEHAWNNEARMHERKAKELDAITRRFYKPEEIAKWGETFDRWEANGETVRVTKEGALILLLNRGTDTNLDRVLNGFGIDEPRLREITDKLDKRDGEFAEAVWEYLDTFWPEAKALEMDVKGAEPTKVKAREVITPHGVLKGGYFPLAYDTKKSGDAYKNMLDRNALYKKFSTAAAHTEQGFLRSRVESLARPIRLDFSGMYDHLDDVIHDITHRKAVIDVARFLAQPDAKAAIINAIGLEGYRKIGEDLRAVGSTQAEFLTPTEKKVRWFRFATTFSSLGYRLGALPADMSTNTVLAMDQVGFKNFIGAVGDLVTGNTITTDFVNQNSPLMAGRAISREASLMELAKEWRGERSNFKAFAFMFQTLADRALGYPVWAATYKQNVAAHGRERAAMMADEAIVKTFGSGRELDKVGAQRGGEMSKAISMFYSWHSMMFNRAWLSGKIAGLEYNDANYGKALAISANAAAVLWVIPAAIDSFWSEYLRNTPETNEDERKRRIATRFIGGPFSFFPMARSIAAPAIPMLLGGRSQEYHLSPLEGAIQNLVQTAAHGGNILGTKLGIADGKEFDQRFAEQAARSASVLMGLPQQLNTWTFNFIDWLNDEGEANWRDIITRRKKK